MNGVKDKIWFARGGLFAKYVISLVGLVVFVLAVNGAMETWISYRATKTSLTDGMAEKAEATARRIEQSIADLERQISWVTRASARPARPISAAPTTPSCCNQVPAVSQLSCINGSGREELRLSRSGARSWQQRSISPATSASPIRSRAAPAFVAGLFPRQPARSCRLGLAHSGFTASLGVTVAEIDLRFLSDFLGDAQVGKAASPMSSIPRARCWRAPPRAPTSARISRAAAGRSRPAPGGAATPPAPTVERARGADRLERGAETRLARVLRAADRAGAGADPRPAGAHRAPDRARAVVAMLAGTVLARRMLIPITALRAGARRLGDGDFGHRIDVQTIRRAGRARRTVQQHGRRSCRRPIPASNPR